MEFTLDKSIDILRRTPDVLSGLLQDVSEDWSMHNEGPDTFSPYDVVGHLVHGERTDWMARLEIILEYGESKPFDPYDRFAQFTESRGKSLNTLLDEFRSLRESNMARLEAKQLRHDDFSRRGTHPSLGTVTLENLVSAWAVHDLGHIAQITRVMAKQYKEAVGPWIQYHPVLTR